MKRDLDLIRKILIKIEEDISYSKIPENFQIEEYNDEVVQYHLGLLKDRNLIYANDFSSSASQHFIVIGMTWEGHDFLDMVRNDNIWKKTKAVINEKLTSTSFEVLKYFLIETAK